MTPLYGEMAAPREPREIYSKAPQRIFFENFKGHVKTTLSSGFLYGGEAGIRTLAPVYTDLGD
jgi:hypothetical protein